MTLSNQMIIEAIATGKEFLYREELRTLKNLSWIPKNLQSRFLSGLNLAKTETKFVLTWLEVDTDPFQDFWKYYQWLNLDYCAYLDIYENCYDANYNLTTFGQELHDESAALVTQPR